MKAQEKAEELMSIMLMSCKGKSDAKIAAILVCTEVLSAKNFESVLNKELVDFQNSYWNYVIEYIHKY